MRCRREGHPARQPPRPQKPTTTSRFTTFAVVTIMTDMRCLYTNASHVSRRRDKHAREDTLVVVQHAEAFFFGRTLFGKFLIGDAGIKAHGALACGAAGYLEH